MTEQLANLDTIEQEGPDVCVFVRREHRAALLSSFLTVKSVKFTCTPYPNDEWEFVAEKQATLLITAFLNGC
jgi:hypothetical protein